MNKAIFIDRDGTLIKDIPYNKNPDIINLEYYAGEMLQQMKRKDYLLIVISNQPGVAKGFYNEDDVYKMHSAINEKLLIHDVCLDAFFYCPHFSGGKIKEYAIDCACRKPKPGLILKAAKEFDIDLNDSWMIGDILDDVEAGNTAGCKTILIDNGNETEWLLKQERVPEYCAENLQEAADIVLKYELEIM